MCHGQRTERPAGSSQNDLGHAFGSKITFILRRQGLKNRIVFTVDRQQASTGLPHRLHEQLTGDDQRFLVGQQNRLARTCGGQRWPQAGCTHNGGHDHIDFASRGHLLHRIDTDQHLGTAILCLELGGKRCAGILLQHHDKARIELQTLLQQAFQLGMPSQRKHLITLRVARNYVQRTETDRASSAQNGDTFTGISHGTIQK